MHNISYKKILSCSKIEYRKWITNPRMILLVLLMAFIYNFAVEPLLQNAERMEEKLNLLEPFIAIINSPITLLFIPLVFLSLIADYPVTDGNAILYIHRIGRINWLIAQLVLLFLMTITYLTIVFASSCISVIFNSHVSSEWSVVVTEFEHTFPDLPGNFGVQLLPKNLYNQLSIMDALTYSFFLVFAYLFIIGLLLLMFTLLKSKILGFVICGGIISIGSALCILSSKLMWVFPEANAITWVHYTEYYRKPIMPMWFSVLYLCFFIILLITFSFIAVKKMNYDNISEVTA